jgi:CBS domain containing-hemolysin-like protein
VAFVVVTEGLGRYLPLGGSAGLLVAVLPVARLMGVLTLPLSFPVLALHRWALRWRGMRGEVEDEGTAEDEILSLLEQDAESQSGEAAMEADERRMIRGVLDLDEMTVSGIMTPRVDVDGVDERADIAAVKAFIVASGHSRVPVFRDTVDHIIGIVHAKDLLDEGRVAAAAGVADLLHTPVFVPESKRLGDLLKEFQQSRNHIAVVLDEYGGTAGIVTIEDILEEIVGDIRDEYDTEDTAPAAEVLPDGAMLVDARTTIDAVNEALDCSLPTDGAYDTVGGYVSAEAGRIPEAGETITTPHLVAEIIAADPRRILKAKVRARCDLDSDRAAAR